MSLINNEVIHPPQTRNSKYIYIQDCNYCILDCYVFFIPYVAVYPGTRSKNTTLAKIRETHFFGIRTEWKRGSVRVGTFPRIKIVISEIKAINLVALDIVEDKKEEVKV